MGSIHPGEPDLAEREEDPRLVSGVTSGFEARRGGVVCVPGEK